MSDRSKSKIKPVLELSVSKTSDEVKTASIKLTLSKSPQVNPSLNKVGR